MYACMYVCMCVYVCMYVTMYLCINACMCANTREAANLPRRAAHRRQAHALKVHAVGRAGAELLGNLCATKVSYIMQPRCLISVQPRCLILVQPRWLILVHPRCLISTSWKPVCNRGVSYHVCVCVSYHVMTGSGHPALAPLVRNQCHTPVISTHIFMSFHNRINIHMCTVAIQMPSLLWSCSVFGPWV